MARNEEQPLVHSLGLRAGEWIEVRSAEEIASTLDQSGCLDSLPFMPEMLEFCGKRLRVFKVAHKACDTIVYPANRRMPNAVHLEGLRCDGGKHGGCQAGCLLYWKEAWLKRAQGPVSKEAAPIPVSASELLRARLELATQVATEDSRDEVRYRCQATELHRATGPISWWDPRYYVKDLSSGNVGVVLFVRTICLATYNFFMRKLGLNPRPYVKGTAGDKTPAESLNLQPGERVQVRPKEEIMQTINAKQRNRGLWFDVEMLPFCGGTYEVLRRVDRIVDEKTGKMMKFPNECIILKGVACGGCLSKERLFCPRSIYPYWREIWLKRVEQTS